MKKLTMNTIAYLKLQQAAGITAFQLFDTWAGILRVEDYQNLVLPYVQDIFSQVQLNSIYYVKNCHHLLPSLKESGSEFLSVCHTVRLGAEPQLDDDRVGIQGNLSTTLLYADEKTLLDEVQSLLVRAKQYKRYIFNLSHGVTPDADVNKLKLIVNKVHSFE
jgi:uroporphyrinogen decarboxylase